MMCSNVRNEPRRKAGNSGQETCRQLSRRADAGRERAQKTALRQLAEGEPYDTAKEVRRGRYSDLSTYRGVALSLGNLGASRDHKAPIVTPELNYCSREYSEGKGQGFYTSPSVSCDRFAQNSVLKPPR